MAKLSTHVLDTSIGKPAEGVKIDLAVLEDGEYRAIKTVTTNSDGRTDELLLDAGSMRAGEYELVFHVGDYFGAGSVSRFLDRVPIRFRIYDPGENYHVPLVVTPWAYSTYRGS